MIAWNRRLEVKLTSTLLKKSMTFGTNAQSNGDDLSIEISCQKYMSTLKDECTIRIKNLTQAEIVQIIQGKYFDVEIRCGYSSSSLMTIFDGGVLFISNQIEDARTNTVIILCGSKLIARFSQKRLNLTLNSGINKFAAMNYVLKRAGVPNSNVSTQFKKQFIEDISTVVSTPASWFADLCSENSSYITNSDSITNGVMSIFDARLSNSRVIPLRNDNIILTQYPQLTEEGLTLSMMPTLNLMCGDTIKIDSSIIQIPVANKTEMSKNYGYFLDEDGMYMIYQMRYVLQNRGQSFKLDLMCKSRNKISSLIGVSK